MHKTTTTAPRRHDTTLGPRGTAALAGPQAQGAKPAPPRGPATARPAGDHLVGGAPAAGARRSALSLAGAAQPGQAAPTGGAAPTGEVRQLARGARGEDVRQMQERLKAHGIDPGPIDGQFGPLTQAAVRRFQEAQGLGTDGIAGPKTHGALAKAPDPNAPRPAPAPVPPADGQGARDYKDLARFAEARGFTVTSTNGGKHNTGSAHYQGRAIDVRTRDKSSAQVEQFIREARAAGFVVHDERSRPRGQKVWSGPHLHLEIARR